ncbi:NifB/NifX family molybdenum-iron cluster-binding protein [Psychromonas antarctica]|jgi:nitrogen fixation protein NifX|uniref:NifB/NifX family molybdenum-iron cluster-binding protein n=1 Tax=Psychromonas antarctica TaxID=67573 RepID=UPI001EE92FFA|nr:NifB/NifX family molybdenum-iron cluster-binding protein [Psychromonas antarctica]MCG6200812.1 NifB/NifX family molybdenum-iron cluster-binding protein [Psychromonas antarctica]
MTTVSRKLLIAFASTDGKAVDGHFGSCEKFYIYRLDAEQIDHIEVRNAEGGRGSEKNSFRAQIIKDCQLMFCASIGGPAAAKVIRAGIHPLKSKDNPSIDAQLLELQQRVSSGALPPWLAKHMGQEDYFNERFSALE